MLYAEDMDVLDLVKGSNSMQPDAGSSEQLIVRIQWLNEEVPVTYPLVY